MILSLCRLVAARTGERAVLMINTMCSADREKASAIQSGQARHPPLLTRVILSTLTNS